MKHFTLAAVWGLSATPRRRGGQRFSPRWSTLCVGGAVRADRAVLSEAGQWPPAGRRFVGIDLGREPVPDETTVCRFRHLLEEHDLGRQLFDEVGLGDSGVLLGPVVTSPRNDFHSARVKPSVHAISIEFDLSQSAPSGAFFTSAASCGLTHLGRPSEWPPSVLFIDFAITAAREVLSSTRVQRPRRTDMPRASWRGYLSLSLVSCPTTCRPRRRGRNQFACIRCGEGCRPTKRVRGWTRKEDKMSPSDRRRGFTRIMSRSRERVRPATRQHLQPIRAPAKKPSRMSSGETSMNAANT